MTAFADKDPALPRCISQQTESAFSSVQRGLRLTHAGVLPGLWKGFQEAGSSPRARVCSTWSPADKRVFIKHLLHAQLWYSRKFRNIYDVSPALQALIGYLGKWDLYHSFIKLKIYIERQHCVSLARCYGYKGDRGGFRSPSPSSRESAGHNDISNAERLHESPGREKVKVHWEPRWG